MDKKTNPASEENESSRAVRERVAQIVSDMRLMERLLPTAFLVGVLLVLAHATFFSPPPDAPSPAVLKIAQGQTLAEIASGMKDAHMIRYANVFALTARFLGGNRSVQAGSYFFPAPQSAFTIALRLIEGDFELKAVRVSVPENATVKEISEMLAQKIAPFDKDGFLSAAADKEGYLYPDTYFFYPAQDPELIIQSMTRDLGNRLSDATTSALIASSKKPLAELITMASIIAGEAATYHDRQMVSGILWKRISIGMPLQVDAPFGYIFDKSLTQLTHDDLSVDSPYNTYKNKGLPPTPIGSPGITAIRAAANPIKSPYLFYLSDRRGVMHYSKTYAQHLQNIALYLK